MFYRTCKRHKRPKIIARDLVLLSCPLFFFSLSLSFSLVNDYLDLCLPTEFRALEQQRDRGSELSRHRRDQGARQGHEVNVIARKEA